MPESEAATLAMPTSATPVGRRIETAFWTLSDQAIVSLGSFLVNIALARHLPSAEYGTYGLLFSGIVTLQMALSSLVFHPLSIRRSVATGLARSQLTWASFAIGGMICIPLASILCLILWVTGRADLLPPALALFLAWQMQEIIRRNLLSELRFQAAALGDGTVYLGQAGLAITLGATGHLSLPVLLWCAAGLFFVAALIQLTQLTLTFAPVNLRSVGRDFWAAGSWSLLSNAVSALRIQSAPWLLAVIYGPAAVAVLQAATNLVNLANPVMTALCNVIPQTAARESRRGARAAWGAARFYIMLVSPLIVLFLGLTMGLPDWVLRTVYGPLSSYLGVAGEVRILVIAAALGFPTEMICSYFHGVDRARAAFEANLTGLAASLLAIPLIWSLGVTGACLAVVFVHAVRSIAAFRLLGRVLSTDGGRSA